MFLNSSVQIIIFSFYLPLFLHRVVKPNQRGILFKIFSYVQKIHLLRISCTLTPRERLFFIFLYIEINMHIFSLFFLFLLNSPLNNSLSLKFYISTKIFKCTPPLPFTPITPITKKLTLALKKIFFLNISNFLKNSIAKSQINYSFNSMPNQS